MIQPDDQPAHEGSEDSTLPEPRAEDLEEAVPREIALHAPPRQRALILRWLPSLIQLSGVDVVWLEGSLVSDRANPGSDIDIRFGIADAVYEQLWERDRTPLLVGLGEHLVLVRTFLRALTTDGLIVEAWAFRTSELHGLERYEWEILYSRLPDGEPAFIKLPPRSPAETWPEREPLTVEVVRNLTNMMLLLMATVPATLHADEKHSARFTLDDLRTELIKIMYRRLGLAYAKRSKHLSTVLPADWLSDLERTHMPAGVEPFDRNAIAGALVATFDVVGRHLHALGEQTGGGFEQEWYGRLHQQIRTELSRF